MPNKNKVLVGKIIEIKHGFAFKSQYYTQKGYYVLLTPGNFKEEGGFQWMGDKQKYYDGEIPENYLLKKDDLLVAMTEQSPGLLGSTILIPEDNRYLHNQRLGLVLFKEEYNHLVHKQYIQHYFNSEDFRKYISSTSAGTKVKHTSPSKICKAFIYLPKIREQKKIAEILSTWDKAIALTKELIAAKQKLKKGLLQKLFSNEYRDQIWKKSKLKDFVSSLDAGVSVNSIDRCIEDNEIGILKTSSVTYGVFLPNEHKVVIAQERNLVTISPKKDRIIISRMNTPKLVGASVYIDQDYPYLFIPDRLWQIEPKSDVFSMKWLSYFLSLDNTRFRISSLATGTSNSMKNISKKSLFNLKLSVPSIEKQESIVRLLTSIDSEIEKYKKTSKAISEQKRGLMQKLLTGEWRVNTEKVLKEIES